MIEIGLAIVFVAIATLVWNLAKLEDEHEEEEDEEDL